MLLAFRVGGLAFRSSAAAVKRETVRWKNSPSAVGGVRLKSGEAAKSSPEKALSMSVLEEVILAEKPKPTTFGGKVAQKAENTILYGIVAVSLAALGAFAYVLGEQFFAADSPQKIYSRALARIREDGRCQDLFGEKIAGFGEDGGRGRRRHVAHHKYKKDGQERIRVLFHLKGERDEGTAQVEMACEDGTWQERFLFVETKSHPKITHILVDNR